MENTEKNKEKLLLLLQNKPSEDEKNLAEEIKVPTMQKIINSPTPLKSLNLLFWILFLGLDLAIGFIIYIYWF